MAKSMKKKDILGISIALLFVAVLLIIIILIINSLLGNTTITNNVTTVEKTQSLECEADDFEYPLMSEETGDKSSIKINAVFDNDKLSTTSLEYKMYFDSKERIERSEVRTRIIMNDHFSEDGLPADTLGVNYTRLEDAMQLSLYSKVKELNSITAKYFLLEDASGHYSYDSVKKVYTDLGLKCVAKK